MQIKKCSVCGEELPITEYYKLNKTAYHARCKKCYALKQQKYYQDNKQIIQLKKKNKYYELVKLMQNESECNLNPIKGKSE